MRNFKEIPIFALFIYLVLLSWVGRYLVLSTLINFCRSSVGSFSVYL